MAVAYIITNKTICMWEMAWVGTYQPTVWLLAAYNIHTYTLYIHTLTCTRTQTATTTGASINRHGGPVVVAQWVPKYSYIIIIKQITHHRRPLRLQAFFWHHGPRDLKNKQCTCSLRWMQKTSGGFFYTDYYLWSDHLRQTNVIYSRI